MRDELEISLRQRGDDAVRLRRDEDQIQLRRAAILSGDRRVAVPPAGLLIGRDAKCDLQLVSGLVAAKHARIRIDGARATVTDLGSKTGTYVNGEHFLNTARPLRGGDSIAIGDEVLYFVTTQGDALPPIEVPMPHSQLRMDRAELRLGRDAANDVVLDHPTVSAFHAEIVAGEGGAWIKNLSHGGTGLRINGRLVSRSFLATGDEIAIGPFRLVFDGELLQQRTPDRGLRLDAERITFDVGAKTILQPTSLAIVQGELAAIIGPSGAGKSTLLKLLCGVNLPTSGRITLDGEPVRSRTADIGYVPQDEIVHPLLTVREALDYAAELRLPLDTSADDRTVAVSRVMEEVGLTPHADTRIADLSGGQRKRAGVATELISQPGLLVLDEPTTGLDPGLEQRLMLLFQSLAHAGRSVLVATHATRSLRLCDKVIVMAEGGYLSFAGSPDDALAFFGVEHFDDLYMALDGAQGKTWSDKFGETTRRRLDVIVPPDTPRRAQPLRPILPQISTLVRRRVTTLSRDTRNLWILGIQVPIFGLLLAVLFTTHVFADTPGQPMFAGLTAQLLFLVITVALWFGCLASAREIVKERAVVDRELAVGLRIPAYLLSKSIVLCSLTGAQTIAVALIVFTLRPLHDSASTELLVVGILVVTSWVAVAMSLLVSASVSTEDQAMSFIPLLLIPQLLFGGSVMPVHQMALPLKLLSKVAAAQWAFAAVGNAVHMNTRIRDDAVFRTVSRYGHSFFALPAAVSLLVLLSISALAAGMLYRHLSRRRPA